MNLVRTLTLAILCVFSSAYADNNLPSNIVNDEVKDVVYDLQNRHNDIDRSFIKYFSLLDVSPEKRDGYALATSFMLHSLVGPGGDNPEANAGSYYPIALMKDDKFVPMTKVPDSKTLYWIDIRNYNFTQQAWEAVASLDNTFVEPIVHHDISGLMRLLSGNAVLRASWFVYYASDVERQVSANQKVKIYNTLLYANVKEPKTVKEFEKIWGINEEESRKIGNEYSTLVTKSKNVAIHNRLMFGYRSPLGWLYRTFDVLNEEGIRDYLQSIPEFKGNPPPAGTFDAGEIFAANSLKMMVYGLNDKDEKLVDFADSRAVRDNNDVTGNPTVRVAHGCFSCHGIGPLQSENTLKEYLDARMRLYNYEKGDTLRIDRSLLSGKFEDAIVEDETAYAKALLKVNGMKPLDNTKNYLNIISEYNEPLTLKDVARECGVTEAKIIEAAAGGLNNANIVPARLDLLIKTGEGIPRRIFDSPGRDGRPGVFQQTMNMIYGYTAVKTELVIKYEILNTCDIMNKQTKVGSIPKGTILDQAAIQGKQGEWVLIEYQGKSGYILNANLMKR